MADPALDAHAKHHHQDSNLTILPGDYTSKGDQKSDTADCTCCDNCIYHCGATSAPVAGNAFLDRMVVYNNDASSTKHLDTFKISPVLELLFRPPIYLS